MSHVLNLLLLRAHFPKKNMERTTRLYILLVLTLLFFFVELFVGYYAGSIALVADSFHMLSDVLSLIIALYAIKLAASKKYEPRYSYGWQRAEVLGALVNGVFLLALCFTIYLEAIQRFFEPKEIERPVLILVVGTAGLLVNVIGLFLFHEHGHGHGGHSHGHGGHGHGKRKKNTSRKNSGASSSSSSCNGHHNLISIPTASSAANNTVAASAPVNEHTPLRRPTRHSFTGARLPEEIAILPARTHSQIIQAANDLQHQLSRQHYSSISENDHRHHHNHDGEHQHDHDHDHEHEDSHSHDHGMMNMHGVFLHVLGDALGSVAVIASGLVIWLCTSWENRFIVDPIISILITTLIVSLTIPLVKGSCLILLQGVPQYIDIEEVRRNVCKVNNVLSVHDLHVWQLSDTKMVASMHVMIPKEADAMRVQSEVQNVLHGYGVHSTTVQPEVVGSLGTVQVGNNKRSFVVGEDDCLLRCATECTEERCCDVESSSGPEAL